MGANGRTLQLFELNEDNGTMTAYSTEIGSELIADKDEVSAKQNTSRASASSRKNIPDLMERGIELAIQKKTQDVEASDRHELIEAFLDFLDTLGGELKESSWS